MTDGDPGRVRRGDRGFLFRLLGAASVVLVLAALVLGLLDNSKLGSCAARGFLEVTDSPDSD